MSTVAYRDSVMAADRYGERHRIRAMTQKLYRVRDAVIGYTGSHMDRLTFVRWYDQGANLDAVPQFRSYRGSDDAPDFDALVLTSAGLTQWTEHFQPIPLPHEPFFAIGSGAAAAMAAMYMGADAIKAVEIAGLVDVATGRDQIDVERLGQETMEAVA